MAGVTDRAFREICALCGSPALFTSEMISAKGLIYKNDKTLNLIRHSRNEKPFVIQLFGSDPDDFKKACEIILSQTEHKPDIIDVNMGCPAPKIIKNNSGSALMKTPRVCGEIVRAIKSVVKIPVTVKIRSGYDNQSVNAALVAQICEQNGVDAITIHGRTRTQMYSGKVSLDVIKSVKQAVKIPVIGNGDVRTLDDAKTMFEQTGCDLIAIGRGSLGNPWIFEQINNYFLNNKITPPPNIDERVRIIIAHINKVCEYKTETVGVKEARKHIAWYLKGLPNSTEIKRKINGIKTKDELIAIIYNRSQTC